MNWLNQGRLPSETEEAWAEDMPSVVKGVDLPDGALPPKDLHPAQMIPPRVKADVVRHDDIIWIKDALLTITKMLDHLTEGVAHIEKLVPRK